MAGGTFGALFVTRAKDILAQNGHDIPATHIMFGGGGIVVFCGELIQVRLRYGRGGKARVVANLDLPPSRAAKESQNLATAAEVARILGANAAAIFAK